MHRNARAGTLTIGSENSFRGRNIEQRTRKKAQGGRSGRLIGHV
jgi:hypothetical protein